MKATLENLRSCLDYCIHDIDECILRGKRKILYFPYSDTKEDFEKKIKKSFPTLRNKNERIYGILESVQDFNNIENSWLSTLCGKTNTVKHNGLLKQKRQDNFNVKIPGVYEGTNSSVTFVGCTVVKEGKSIPLDLSIDTYGNMTSQGPIDSRLSVEKIDWVTFTIEGMDEDLLDFLTRCYNEIQEMVTKIYTEIEE